MARRTLTIITDDFDGTEGGDVASVSFTLDGVSYSIDLSRKNRTKLEKALAPYIERASRTDGTRQARRTRGRNVPSPSTVRDWARAQGIGVPARGRIPAEVHEAYAIAH